MAILSSISLLLDAIPILLQPVDMAIWARIKRAWSRCGSVTPLLTHLNCLGLLLAIPILLAAIVSVTKCYNHFLSEEHLQIIIGALLLVVSLTGIVGAFFHVRWLVWAHIVGLLLLLVLLGVRLTIFAGENPQNGLNCPNDQQRSALSLHNPKAACGRGVEDRDRITREDSCTSRQAVEAVDQVARFLCAQALLSSMQATRCEEWCMASKNMTAAMEEIKGTTDGLSSDRSRLWAEEFGEEKEEEEEEKAVWRLRQAEKRLFVVLIILLLFYSVCGCCNFPAYPRLNSINSFSSYTDPNNINPIALNGS